MRKADIIIVTITLIALIVAGAFSACQTGHIMKEETSPNIYIRVANWDTDAMPYIPVLIEEFEAAHPGIIVEIIDIPSRDFETRLSIILNGGIDLDAFWIRQGDTTKVLADAGHLADLSCFMRRDGIDLSDFMGLGERFIMNDAIVALPFRFDYYVLFFNKDIFDAVGEPYPNNDMTWGEYEELVARLTHGSGPGKIYGGFFHTWQALVQNWGVQHGQQTIMGPDYSFFRPYYEMVLRMQEAGHIMDFGFLRAGSIHYTSLFYSGTVATMPMGTWFMSMILGRMEDEGLGFNWGISTIPRSPNLPMGYTVGSVTPIAISSASGNKDAAWEFVRFVTSTEGANILAEYFIIPSRAWDNYNEDTLRGIAEASGMPAGALEALYVANISFDRPMESKAPEVNQMLGEIHELIMLGEISIDEGLTEMERLSRIIQTMPTIPR